TADGHHRVERRGRTRAIAAVTGRGSDGDALVVVRRALRRVAAAVAVADRRGTVAGRVVHGGPEGGERRRRGFGEQGLAVRAGGRDHVQVQADLGGPARVGGRVAGAAGLVHLLQAAVGRGAGRQAELRAVHAEIGFGGRVVVGVDDGHRPA